LAIAIAGKWLRAIYERTRMSVSSEIHAILDPGVNRIEDGKHPDIGDAMNLLGRVVDAIEHLAAKIDEVSPPSQ
jgi:hypothetical protein